MIKWLNYETMLWVGYSGDYVMHLIDLTLVWLVIIETKFGKVVDIQKFEDRSDAVEYMQITEGILKGVQK